MQSAQLYGKRLKATQKTTHKNIECSSYQLCADNRRKFGLVNDKMTQRQTLVSVLIAGMSFSYSVLIRMQSNWLFHTKNILLQLVIFNILEIIFQLKYFSKSVAVSTYLILRSYLILFIFIQ